ncbi:MAG: hypothetical protein KME17_15505 [Cyanosarcina radialis HA8281-LM2]|jgi:hypothetical protein|nr:hypothetical protein [Cyanosarcina radialis HA8281-LM2]
MTKTQVFEVKRIELFGERSLKVSGTVTTDGWKNAELIKRSPSPSPSNEFDFVAQSPDGSVPQVITPIEAIYEISPVDIIHSNHFVVYASQNRQEVTINDLPIPEPAALVENF